LTDALLRIGAVRAAHPERVRAVREGIAVPMRSAGPAFFGGLTEWGKAEAVVLLAVGPEPESVLQESELAAAWKGQPWEMAWELGSSAAE
jgi:hypothetical protein